LTFSSGAPNELKELKSILDLFLKATGMQINPRKSQMSVEGMDRQERVHLQALFPFQYSSMDTTFKYLGFWLKPGAYKKRGLEFQMAL